MATDRAIRHQCACKSMPLPPADSESKAERQARMAALREISSMLGLEHPNVVGLREYFVESNRVYLIMELLRGEQGRECGAAAGLVCMCSCACCCRCRRRAAGRGEHARAV